VTLTRASPVIDAPIQVERAQIYVCDWIPPEFGAVGQYTMQRARRAAGQGERVVIIGLGRENGNSVESIGEGQLSIVRLGAKRSPKESLVRRAIWSFFVNARLIAATAAALRQNRRSTILVTGSPPLLSYLVLLNNALFWRTRIVYRITDFYPEVAFAAGKARWLTPTRPLFGGLRRLANTIEVLGEDQRRRLRDDGIPPSRISLFRDDSPVEDWASSPPVARPFSDNSRILLYSGNFGVAHDVDTLCEAYRRHIRHGANRVRLWINGTGVRVADVKAYCEHHGLPLAVTGPVPLEQLPGVLKAADAHLITLSEPFWGYVLPSKVYACLEAGQPILFVGPAESDVHLLASRHATTYWRAQPGDVEAAFRALEEMSEIDPGDHHAPSRLSFQNLKIET
jgi:hypothetical protein